MLCLVGITHVNMDKLSSEINATTGGSMWHHTTPNKSGLTIQQVEGSALGRRRSSQHQKGRLTPFAAHTY